ncbi:hypothetical protein BDY21DRAFT_178370 [Lineolata rhizophorae]|uniref:Uncharacterized protein n=1 Tax=Lineolata rhizophorae TaxID=578093 RepID=A0A6A6P7N3_9PEZI|nr:hypothetical protein BDY21DRAFT_178370 [Lineolata rhizophorae]
MSKGSLCISHGAGFATLFIGEDLAMYVRQQAEHVRNITGFFRDAATDQPGRALGFASIWPLPRARRSRRRRSLARLRRGIWRRRFEDVSLAAGSSASAHCRKPAQPRRLPPDAASRRASRGFLRHAPPPNRTPGSAGRGCQGDGLADSGGSTRLRVSLPTRLDLAASPTAGRAERQLQFLFMLSAQRPGPSPYSTSPIHFHSLHPLSTASPTARQSAGARFLPLSRPQPCSLHPALRAAPPHLRVCCVLVDSPRLPPYRSRHSLSLSRTALPARLYRLKRPASRP